MYGTTHDPIVQILNFRTLEFNIKPKFIGNSEEVDFDIELGTEGISGNSRLLILKTIKHCFFKCVFEHFIKLSSRVQLSSMANFTCSVDSVNQSKLV